MRASLEAFCNGNKLNVLSKKQQGEITGGHNCQILVTDSSGNMVHQTSPEACASSSYVKCSGYAKSQAKAMQGSLGPGFTTYYRCF